MTSKSCKNCPRVRRLELRPAPLEYNLSELTMKEIGQTPGHHGNQTIARCTVGLRRDPLNDGSRSAACLNQVTVPLRVPCPGQGCGKTDRAWYCATCDREWLYGDACHQLYCACGFAPAGMFIFQCDSQQHRKHGFVPFPGIINRLRSFTCK